MAEPPRPSGSNPRPGRPSPQSGYDRRQLLEAYQTLVRSEQERQAAGPPPPPKPPSRAPFWVATLTLIALLAAGLALRPAWLFNEPKPEPRELMEAGLRVQMFVEVEKIERFKEQTGRLPSSAEEVGIAAGSGVRYEGHGQNYTLTGTYGPVTLTYSSGTPPNEFLGNSYQVIRGREASR
jgi:hypothetical protein